MTYRERREAKAARLREWAEKREVKAEIADKRCHDIMDGIPLGQPILVGHHSEKRARRDQERIWNLTAATIEHANKAADFQRRAAGIEAQADRSIYSDDEDAVERLRERIAELEAQRARQKYINSEIKRGTGWTERITPALTDEEKDDLEIAARFSGKVGYPPYSFANLSGNINRQKKRLAQMEAQS